MDLKILCTLVVFCFGISTTVGQLCADKLSYCSQWPDSYCTTYKDYMKTNCPKKCGYCTVVKPTDSGTACTDKQSSSNCVRWKNSGYCADGHRFQQYMKDNCQKTCGFCGSCSASSKLDGCSFDSDSCDFVDVPFDDDHDFVLQTSGGQDNGGYLSSTGRGKADLIVPLELLVSHNGDYGTMCMEFYYRIRSGSLVVYQVTNGKTYPKETKLQLSDSRGSWKKARVNFRASQKYHLLFRSTPNSGSVHIDNVRFCSRCN
ncbi:uncharacterized protein LOC114518946 isoform X2 [Dendronephthya gigantea]|uniref:uncharacterized protein LOC114518946 isoform X2 n=1 Tax=Dendronephthya gigantea TaxID=151771 RepID=UPI00106BAFDB|nr:uncharacterized protein LOC114518946 isoform X2 [Dendronephthya gigantea]